MRKDLQQLQLPEAARARLEVERKPRAIATRKLRDVLARAVATPAIRTIWIHGSYARGASTVGDVDLMIEVDDAREQGHAAWDGYQAYIRGRNPDSDILNALGASGSSMIEAVISRNHDQAKGEPLPVDDWRKLPRGERERFAPASPPQLQLLGSGEVVETAMSLVYCRGDDLLAANSRLLAIPENASAARFPRTTGIPLLDELASRVGGDSQAILERYLRSGAIDVAVHVVEPPASSVLPPAVEAALSRRFAERRRRLEGRGPSQRHQLVRAVLYALGQRGIDASSVWIFGDPADGHAQGEAVRVLVDSGGAVIRRLGERLVSRERGASLFDRVVFVIDRSRKAPWIVLDFTARDQGALAELVDQEGAELRALLGRRQWPHDLQ